MSSNTLIEVFGHIVFSFTRGVTEHYNPEEPEFTAESFGYNPLESTGREWYYHPVEELIYQEYSDREAISWDYLALRRLNVRVINACSPDENEETQEGQKDEDRAMAWKRLRPSALHTVCKSMYIGALISLLTAIFVGTFYILISYVAYKTKNYCEYHSIHLIPIQVQWFRAISYAILYGFVFFWHFLIMLFLFRPFQLAGVKRTLFLVCFLVYCLDALYCVALQALGISHSRPSLLQRLPRCVLFEVNVCLQSYIITNHFCKQSRRQKLAMFFQIILPVCLPLIVLSQIGEFFIYPAYNKQNRNGKLLIALFAPLIGVVLKVITRICVQRLYNITHPGYSYVLLSPLWFGSAIIFRVLQADLDNLQSITILGIIHGVAEVIERSTMVVIDHICHRLWKRTSAPWGSFRTPRRERLMADIAIMSMLSESIAIVCVNGFFCLYQFTYLKDKFLLTLAESFAINTSVQLAIEWLFTSLSLAIETRYQNMAVMAVWKRQWKRHILLAIINVVVLAIWSCGTLSELLYGRFSGSLNNNQTCKMPFT